MKNFAYTNDTVRNALDERNNQISGIKTKMNANLLESHAALREVTPLKYGSSFSVVPQGMRISGGDYSSNGS